MNKLKVFDRITTPDSWKKAALDNTTYEKPKLKLWQTTLVLAATAAVLVAMVFAPALMLKNHPQIGELTPVSQPDEEIKPEELPRTTDRIEGGKLSSEIREDIIRQMNEDCDLVLRGVILDSFDPRDKYDSYLDQQKYTGLLLDVGALNSYNVFNRNGAYVFMLDKEGIDYTSGSPRIDLTGNIDKDFGDEVTLGLSTTGQVDSITGMTIYKVTAYLNLGPTTNFYFQNAKDIANLMKSAGIEAEEQAIIKAQYMDLYGSYNAETTYVSSWSDGDAPVQLTTLKLDKGPMMRMSFSDDYVMGGAFKVIASDGSPLTLTLSDRKTEDAAGTYITELTFDAGDLGKGTMNITTDGFFCRECRELVIPGDDPSWAWVLILCECDESVRDKGIDSGEFDISLTFTDSDEVTGTASIWGNIWGREAEPELYIAEDQTIQGSIPDYDISMDEIVTATYNHVRLDDQVYFREIMPNLTITRQDGTPIEPYSQERRDAWNKGTYYDDDEEEYLMFSDIPDYVTLSGEDQSRRPSGIYGETVVVVKDYEHNRKFLISTLDQEGMWTEAAGWGQPEDNRISVDGVFYANTIEPVTMVVWEGDWDTDYTRMTDVESLDDPDSEFYCPNKVTIHSGTLQLMPENNGGAWSDAEG